MTVESNGHPRRWAPEWIAVLTLTVAIVALGGGLFASLNAMEGRIREDMRAMESRIHEDTGSMEKRIREDMSAMEIRIREDMALREERIRKDMGAGENRIREDVRDLRGDVGTLRERVTRLEVRFDEEFPPRPASTPSSATRRTSPPQPERL